EILDYAYYYGGGYFADKNNFAGILDYVTQEITFYYAFLDWAAENGYTVTERSRRPSAPLWRRTRRGSTAPSSMRII
ncbi:MAG: hypothetical protein J6Z24_04510, partial [Oscillospiraceae bacterium]|nr:hypothetical protein [Oscillospiraceae bacterium]